MATIIITRTLPTGQHIELGITRESKFRPAAWVDGRPDNTNYNKLPQPVTSKSGITYTHQVGRVAITTEEWEILTAAAAEANAADPGAILADLRTQREKIQAAIGAHDDETAARRERAFNSDTALVPGYDSQARRDLVARLAAFDSEHPEVLAAIRGERAERQAEFERNN